MRIFLSRHWLKITIIIIALTVLFIMDEVLILMLIGELRIWNISPIAYFFLSVIALFLNVSFALVVYRVLKKKPSTGAEGMIGKVGIAIDDFDEFGKISVKGEIWQAESNSKICKGEKVKIIGMFGLVVKIVKLD